MSEQPGQVAIDPANTEDQGAVTVAFKRDGLVILDDLTAAVPPEVMRQTTQDMQARIAQAMLGAPPFMMQDPGQPKTATEVAAIARKAMDRVAVHGLQVAAYQRAAIDMLKAYPPTVMLAPSWRRGRGKSIFSFYTARLEEPKMSISKAERDGSKLVRAYHFVGNKLRGGHLNVPRNGKWLKLSRRRGIRCCSRGLHASRQPFQAWIYKSAMRFVGEYGDFRGELTQVELRYIGDEDTNKLVAYQRRIVKRIPFDTVRDIFHRTYKQAIAVVGEEPDFWGEGTHYYDWREKFSPVHARYFNAAVKRAFKRAR
jgi:hypothetical protein